MLSRIFDAVQNTRSTCFIGFKNTAARVLNSTVLKETLLPKFIQNLFMLKAMSVCILSNESYCLCYCVMPATQNFS